jgi:Putative secretion activating protein
MALITRTPEIDKIIAELIGIEGDGGGKIDANDAGGATRWGVTEAAARADGYTGAMKDYPRDSAELLYLRNYFVKPHFDQVLLRSHRLAAELFEIEVNLPPGQAATFLQRALNALNDPDGDGKVNYPQLEPDGNLGPQSFIALDAFLALRKAQGEHCLLALINSQQAVYYLGRTEARPKNKKYVFGWTMNRIQLA